MMSRHISVLLLLAALLAGRSAHASGIDSSATVIGKPDGSSFDYSITLNNSASSTASIGSLWLAWIPAPISCRQIQATSSRQRAGPRR